MPPYSSTPIRSISMKDIEASLRDLTGKGGNPLQSNRPKNFK